MEVVVLPVVTVCLLQPVPVSYHYCRTNEQLRVKTQLGLVDASQLLSACEYNIWHQVTRGKQAQDASTLRFGLESSLTVGESDLHIHTAK